MKNNHLPDVKCMQMYYYSGALPPPPKYFIIYQNPLKDELFAFSQNYYTIVNPSSLFITTKETKMYSNLIMFGYFFIFVVVKLAFYIQQHVFMNK